jgi:hypothetical protein
MTSHDSGITTQRTVVFNPRTMTFREYDKKMLAFRHDLEYWEKVLQEPKIWETKKRDRMDVYSADEIKKVKATDRVARSIYIQGNSGMTDVYTTHETV